MAFKSVSIAWLTGGALLMGYAGFEWLRSTRGRHGARRVSTNPHAEPLSQRLQRVPRELALNFDDALELAASSNGRKPISELSARFLSRATGAFSPF